MHIESLLEDIYYDSVRNHAAAVDLISDSAGGSSTSFSTHRADARDDRNGVGAKQSVVSSGSDTTSPLSLDSVVSTSGWKRMPETGMKLGDTTTATATAIVDDISSKQLSAITQISHNRHRNSSHKVAGSGTSSINSAVVDLALAKALHGAVYIIATAQASDSLYPTLVHNPQGCLRRVVNISPPGGKARIRILQKALESLGAPLDLDHFGGSSNSTVVATVTLSKQDLINSPSPNMSLSPPISLPATNTNITTSAAMKSPSSSSIEDDDLLNQLTTLTEGYRPGDLWNVGRKIFARVSREYATEAAMMRNMRSVNTGEYCSRFIT
jgi:SpoVK/Ycf46/Vps4 family AAA+-type ATPase